MKAPPIGIIIFLIVMSIVALMVIGQTKELDDRINYCKENGYDGVQSDNNILGTRYDYKCYRKVQLDVGWEYEYSGYID